MPPRARAPPPPKVPAPGAQVPCSGSGSVILPGPVLFELGLTGTVLQWIAPASSRPTQRLTGKRTQTVCNGLCGSCLERSVATVQTEPLQPFGLQFTPLPFSERYK